MAGGRVDAAAAGAQVCEVGMRWAGGDSKEAVECIEQLREEESPAVAVELFKQRVDGLDIHLLLWSKQAADVAPEFHLRYDPCATDDGFESRGKALRKGSDAYDSILEWGWRGESASAGGKHPYRLYSDPTPSHCRKNRRLEGMMSAMGAQGCHAFGYHAKM